MRKFYTIAGLLLAASLSAQTETPLPTGIETTPLQADRPDQTETPALVPVGMFQFETGFVYENTNSGSSSIAAPSILWKYGVNDNFEIRLITEVSHLNTDGQKTSGILPVMIGFKARLIEEKGIIPKTSFIAHLAIPKLASKNFESIFYAPEFRFVMQHTLSERTSFSYNLGAEWDGLMPEPIFIYTTAAGFAITENLGAFVEFYGFAPQLSKAEHNFDGGLTYLLSQNFMIDLSAGFGITDNAPKSFVSAGFSFRI